MAITIYEEEESGTAERGGEKTEQGNNKFLLSASTQSTQNERSVRELKDRAEDG